MTKRRRHKYYAVELAKKITRSKGICERCGKTKDNAQMQGAHIISVTYNATAADLENLMCLCAGCHFWWHRNPAETFPWLEGKWPGRYERLNNKRQTITKPDFEALYLELKKRDTIIL